MGLTVGAGNSREEIDRCKLDVLGGCRSCSSWIEPPKGWEGMAAWIPLLSSLTLTCRITLELRFFSGSGGLFGFCFDSDIWLWISNSDQSVANSFCDHRERRLRTRLEVWLPRNPAGWYDARTCGVEDGVTQVPELCPTFDGYRS